MTTILSQGFGKGGLGTTRRCDATCHKASKPDCACICNGRYHGKGSSEKAQEALTEDALGADWQTRVKEIQRELGPGTTRAQAAWKVYVARNLQGGSTDAR